MPYLEGVPDLPTGNIKYEPLLICFRNGPLTNDDSDPPEIADALALVIVSELVLLVVITPVFRVRISDTRILPPPNIVSPEALFILKS